MDNPPITPVFIERHRRALVGFLVLVLILFSIAGYIYITSNTGSKTVHRLRDPFMRSWAALSLPSELRPAIFASAAGGLNKVYKSSGFGFSTIAVQGATVSVAQHGNKLAILSRTKDGYVLELNGENRNLGPGMARNVSFSPDGTRILYDQTVNTASSALSGWNVSMLSVADSGSGEVLAPGFTPFFISDRHIGFFTEQGLSVLDLSTNIATPLLVYKFGHTVTSFSQSHDRTLIAWQDTEIGKTVVYRVTSNSLRQVAIFSDSFSSFALGSDSLYEIKNDTKGLVQIWKHSLNKEESAPLLTLPSSMAVTDLYL